MAGKKDTPWPGQAGDEAGWRSATIMVPIVASDDGVCVHKWEGVETFAGVYGPVLDVAGVTGSTISEPFCVRFEKLLFRVAK